MSDRVGRAIAVVGVGAVLPDAPDAPTFWDNVTSGRYSISDVDPERWDPELYYDPDPKAPDKTYSTIGGWVRDWNWDPLGWRLPIPPKVSDAMDVAQIWAVIAAREALQDHGYPDRPLDADRTAVVLGNAMGGENQYVSALRVNYPEYARELEQTPSFAALDPGLQATILAEARARMSDRFPEITEDTMPGELANITAGRIANLFNFHGPNFTTDAACASALASFDAGIAGLESHAYDAVLCGGVDANMGASSFIKFCKIGALSATGTRPYADGADGFVMGEGASVFLLKRLEDAEKDGDRIYAVLRGLAGSSDGKGRGITAPNPVGQRFAIERAWRNADSIPDTASYIEGHGTSTKVGDVVEVEALGAVFSKLGLPPGSLPLGSVKSNIGHLKAAAGAAGILKTVMALDAKVLPPSLNADRPNPNIDFERSPLFINTELREWKASPSQVRQAGVSTFGFGGTNFHAVFEEYTPGRIRTGERKVTYSLVGPEPGVGEAEARAPHRGALVVGDESADRVVARLRTIIDDAAAGRTPLLAAPLEADLRAPYRIAIDFGDGDELRDRATKAIGAIDADNAGTWKALRNQGVFHGEGSPELVAFLYPGQGSQYVNMLDGLREIEPIVADVIAEADAVMEPMLGRPLSEVMYADPADREAFDAADTELRKTEITQPAVLTVDAALTRLLAAYGIRPDMVMGHSLGEYGALEAAGALPFPDALEAVAGRGREMAHVDVPDPGLMAAVFAPFEVVDETVAGVPGSVVIANINSTKQAVIGGASDAVREASRRLGDGGFMVVPIPVSHAFHTEIVAPASEPLQELLRRLSLASPAIPLVANVDGEFYPMGPNVAPTMIDILGRQIASPVQFVKGLRTLYDAGCRIFVEVGPKKVLHGFVDDVLGDDDGVIALFANHPKQGDVVSFNQALCGLYAAGLGTGARPQTETPGTAARVTPDAGEAPITPVAEPAPAAATAPATPTQTAVVPDREDTYLQLGHLFADFLERGYDLYRGEGSRQPSAPGPDALPAGENAVITGASLGLPGSDRVFTSDGVQRILGGEVLIDTIPLKLREEMVDRNITRLHKSEAGGGRFEPIDSQADVVKLAGRGGEVDLAAEFGVPEERASVLDRTSTLAIGAGLAALRDAGIPLVLRYKTTTTGTKLPDRWMLPETMRDDTGVIFASAFPGAEFAINEAQRLEQDHGRRARLEELQSLRTRLDGTGDGTAALAAELEHRIHEVEGELERDGYTFDRKYLFKALSMGHAQFAEYVGARGPNTQINGACASVPQAVAISEDWIRTGRCRRVVIISADDVTSDSSLPWIASGFLAVGAVATDEVVEDAATPFDRRRHGMILGMGAAAVVVEGADAVRRRGLTPIAEVLSTVTANSAFHGSRLDRDHIRFVMEKLVVQAEERWGIDRHQIAPNTVFVSHETYTPARGGSAQAEVDALRYVFGDSVDRIVITNTKGFTGHAMATGIEDVVAIKSIETGIVPPIPNFKEEDPDLGHLNLSQGGVHPARYALRLGAGFGSQISLTLYRSVDSPLGRHPEPDELGFDYRIADAKAWSSWLQAMSGYGSPELEVEGRTLRVRDAGPPSFVGTVAPVAAAAAPPAAPVEAAAAAPAEVVTTTAETATADPVHDRVLAIVANETGYPPDMLDLDLDLEADLGIDTVKQAEMFAAIRAEWDIERDDTVALRDYPTLQHVIEFVYERTDLTPTAPVEAVAAAPAEVVTTTAETATADPVHDRVLAIVANETGYPPDMLDLDLDLEADLGIDTVKQAEMFAAIRAEWDIERDDTVALRDYPTLQHVIEFVYERTDLTPTTPVEAVAAAPAEVVTTTAETATADPVHDGVLAIVANETGYRPDMLDLDLDLEADLGIDTVKQAEMFAAIRAEWDIERDDTVALRDYPTLQHVIEFVYEHTDLTPTTPVETVSAPAAPPEPATATAETAPDLIRGDEDAAAAVPRRVPGAVLRPPLELTRPTGVKLDEGSRVVVMADHGGVGRALTKRLEGRAVDVLVIDDALSADELLAHIDEWAADGPVTGVYWLPALDREDSIDEMSIDDWREALRLRVKLLYRTMRHLYDRVGESGTFLVSGTRLGGRHGYDDAGPAAPMGGAVTGFTKTYKREKPEALVKAVDFAPSRKTAALADTLIAETLRDPGAVEIGIADDLRWTVGLIDEALPENATGLELGCDSVFVVTGAAGSIVSAITADLATASRGVFHLLDLVPVPDPADPDIAAFGDNREALKRTIFERLKASGERATPTMVDKELARIERGYAALSAIRAVEQAGGTVRYHSVNLLDADAMAAVTDQISAENGRVDVLLHAGGLEISRLLPDKEPGEYDLVFDVKADGWFNLLSGLRDVPIAATVSFSSIAGRFGNAGQADYSAANDLLCKSALGINALRPETTGIAIDWTAWGDIGMATRGSIPTVMKAAGIDMLPAAAGIPIVRRELTGTSGNREMLVGMRLGMLLEEWHEDGGTDIDVVNERAPESVMTGRVTSFGVNSGLTMVTTLDPEVQPFLDDHRIDGTPVLPGVMGVEAFAAAAHAGFPDRAVTAIEAVAFTAPFKFYRNEPRDFTVTARFRADGGEIVADCRLIGERTIATQAEPQATTHFTGRVRLGPRTPDLGTEPVPAEDEPVVSAQDIYRIYFHGPAYQVLDEAWRTNGAVAGRFAADLPPNNDPPDLGTITAPRLLELCFQTAGVWEIGTSDQMALPMHIERVETVRGASTTTDPKFAVVAPSGDGAFDGSVVDESGKVLVRLEGYLTVPLPAPLVADEVAPLRAAMLPDD